eukprot:g18396.t1
MATLTEQQGLFCWLSQCAMLEPSAASAAAIAAATAPPERAERDADVPAPLSAERLVHLLAELREYHASSRQERQDLRSERVEQKTRLLRLEQQLLAEEQIGQDLARRIETLEEAIRQERLLQEKLSQARCAFGVLHSVTGWGGTKLLPPVGAGRLDWRPSRWPVGSVGAQQNAMAPPRWAASIDAFRSVPKDLAEASATGAVMTLLATVTCAVLFLCETQAFLRSERRSDVALDSNQDSMLTITFDVTMLDMSCDHVTVGVWDAFGTERMNITKNIQKQRIDHKGADKGHPYSEDELTDLEFSDRSLTAEDLAELDSDWSSSSDQFKHDSFESVVDAHDYTFVNFYADWCPHCRMFGPIWDQFEKELNSEKDPVVDADGVKANVRALKINCVDFEEPWTDCGMGRRL